MQPTADATPLYLAATIDLQAAVEWLADTNSRRPVAEHLPMVALFLRAVVVTLHDVPELNGRGPAGDDSVHLALTLGRRGSGVATVVLPDAQALGLDALMRQMRDRLARVRGGEPPPEPVEPTFTVTSLGDQAVQAVFPSIAPPQVAGVGFGRVTEQPSAIGGAIVCSPVVTATLAVDQHVSDSHRAARFLVLLGERLQRPATL